MKNIYIKNKITGEQIVSPLTFEISENDCPNYMSWNNAVKLAETMGIGWRLPTIAELEQMKIHKHVLGLKKASYLSIEHNGNMAFSKGFKWYSASRYVIKQSRDGVRFVRDFNSTSTNSEEEIIPISEKIIRLDD